MKHTITTECMKPRHSFNFVDPKSGNFSWTGLNRIFTPTYVLLHEPLKTCIFITYSCMSQKKSGKNKKQNKNTGRPWSRSNEELNKKKNSERSSPSSNHSASQFSSPSCQSSRLPWFCVCEARGTAEQSRAERSGAAVRSNVGLSLTAAWVKSSSRLNLCDAGKRHSFTDSLWAVSSD